MTRADPDADGCAEQIRTGPLGPGVTVAVRRLTELCVLTAVVPPRMARVRITEVSSDGTATLSATSWSIPGR